MEQISILTRSGGATIAYRHRGGKGPGVLFCTGFHSTMEGDKAQAIAAYCDGRKQQCTRFDYQGHGRSSGRFVDGTIGQWLDDAIAVLDRVTEGPQVVVGSSLGAWMALNLAKTRPERIASLLLIAPAPDFVSALLWPSLDQDNKDALATEGVWYRPSEFEEDPYPISMALIEESRRHTVLDRAAIPFDGPVRILHGRNDEVVPVDHAVRCLDAVTSDDVTLTLVKDGDHQLSTPRDLALLMRTLSALLETT